MRLAVTPECPPACETLVRGLRDQDRGGWRYRPAHASGCVHNADVVETEWCGTCRRRSVVEDRDFGSTYSAYGEEEYAITHLACGHTMTGLPRRVGPAPGAPYVGEQVAVAATTRFRDLQSASRRQRVLDQVAES